MSTSVTDSLSVAVEVITHTTVTVTVVGRLDAARCPELRSEIDRRIAAGCEALVIDLHNATFIDSVGLAALVKAMRDAQGIGAEFWLVRPGSDDAMRVFRLSKFDSVFDMRGRAT
jgi:anti-sigma B factor antagonist